MADDFHTRVRQRVEQLLAPGEHLEGVYAATQQSAFRGGMVAFAVTDLRLLVQPLDRRVQPKGDAVSIAPDDLVALDAVAMGGEWYHAELAAWARAQHGER